MDGKLRNMAGLYLTKQDKMLLLYRIGSKVVAPSWCNIGGHFETDELNDAKACVLREVYEEIGIQESDLGDLTFKYVTLRMKNNELRQNYYFFANLLETELSIDHCDEGILEWVDVDKLLDRDMPFTAKEVLKHYMTTGKFTTKVYAGIAEKAHVTFTELEDF